MVGGRSSLSLVVSEHLRGLRGPRSPSRDRTANPANAKANPSLLPPPSPLAPGGPGLYLPSVYQPTEYR